MSVATVTATAPVERPAILRGGSVLAAAMLLANAGNYVFNLYLGRVLSPAEFSDAALMVTLLFMLTSVALCLQLVAARFVARADEQGFPGDSDELTHRLRRIAVVAGLLGAVVLAGASPYWSTLFQTASSWPFVVLAVGLPFWLAQAVGRGVMQARLMFSALAWSFIVEMVTRVGLGIALVSAGLGVMGATTALTASFVITFTVVTASARPSGGPTGPGVDGSDVRAYTALVAVLVTGQILANNSDVLVAKVFLAPTDAGVYAVVALIGRAVFFLAWSVATVVFPVVVRRQVAGTAAGDLLRDGLVAVGAIGAACALGAVAFGGPVLGWLLGAEYGDLSGALAAYALMTTLFAGANLVASIRMSQARATEAIVLLAASVCQVALLLRWHADLSALITVQYVTVVPLLLALALVARLRRPAHLPLTTKDALP